MKNLNEDQCILDTPNILELSALDQKIFVEALLNPPVPNEELIIAKDKFKNKK